MPIGIIYCGSQLLKPLVDSCLDANIPPVVVPNSTSLHQLRAFGVSGIIITGGSTSVRSLRAPQVDPHIYDSGLPVLGICYGMQRMAHDLGGTVLRTPAKLEGDERVFPNLEVPNPLLDGLVPEGTAVWMSHSYFVSEEPPGFDILGRTETCRIAAFSRGRLFGVQFHPEKPKSGGGKHILHNFLRLCL